MPYLVPFKVEYLANPKNQWYTILECKNMRIQTEHNQCHYALQQKTIWFD